MKSKDRNLYRSYFIIASTRTETSHTFEKSSHDDPSENVISMMPDEKCFSPLHRGNAETLMRLGMLNKMRIKFPHLLSTLCIVARPALFIFPFKTPHI